MTRLIKLFLLYYCGTTYGQTVSNVRIRPLNGSSIEILYDLAGSKLSDSVYIQVDTRKEPLNVLAKYITGDVGQNVKAGKNRRIVWNAVRNGYGLREEIRVRVYLNITPVMFARRPGPGWALLSAAAPGIGNIFVQTPKPKIGLRPIVTVAFYGLLVYGLTQRQQSGEQYLLYEQQKNVTVAEPYYVRANDLHHRYFVATRAAGLIWATDVLATFVRGIRNRTQTPKPYSLRPGYQAGQPIAVFRYSF